LTPAADIAAGPNRANMILLNDGEVKYSVSTALQHSMEFFTTGAKMKMNPRETVMTKDTKSKANIIKLSQKIVHCPQRRITRQSIQQLRLA
jgi:hypothetical protein